MGKILIVPMLTYGHFNCCMNIGRLLIELHPEHEVCFLVTDKWANNLKSWEPKFKSLVYMKDEETWKKNIEARNEKLRKEGKLKEHDLAVGATLNDLMNEFGDEWQKSRIENAKNFGNFCQGQLDTVYEYRNKIEELVNEFDPDVIIFDHCIMIPFLLNRKWIQIMTISPGFMNHHLLPPYSSGLSSNKEIAYKDWIEFRTVFLESTSEYTLNLNLKLVAEGQPCIRPLTLINESPYFNIYIYPKEICPFSVSEQIRLPGKWHRLDSSFLPSKKIELYDPNDREGRFKRIRELYKVPDDFLTPNSKVIFFSLGSMASGYKKITNRLLDLLGNVPGDIRFIVSKGPLGNEITLPDNCIGESFVNQFETLRCVDLMISHGGNNTLTEAFHMGVPLIITPLFSDQPDNAQRLVDTQMGYFLDPFKCSQEELNQTINHALNNNELIRKMQEISKRICKDNGMHRVVKELHELIIS